MANYYFEHQFDDQGIFSVPDPEKNYLYRSDCSIKTKGFTILHKWVLLTKKYPEVEKLIEKYLKFSGKSQIDKVNKKGWSALILAIKNSSTVSTENTVKILLDAGANLDLQDDDNNTALLYCVYDNNINLSRMLIDAGANLNLQNNNGKTALFVSVLKNNFDIASMLVNAGCDLDKRDNRQWTALKRGVFTSRAEKIIQLLVNAGADLDAQCDEGWTALMNACANKNFTNVKILLKNKCDVNLINNSGRSAYDIATTRVIQKLLVEAGYEPGKYTFGGLQIKLQKNYDETIKELGIHVCDKNVDKDCMICFEKHDKILQLPCGHVCCFDEIINYYVEKNIKANYLGKMICFYKCPLKYNFTDCKMISCS